jgi:hypothetical protein
VDHVGDKPQHPIVAERRLPVIHSRSGVGTAGTNGFCRRLFVARVIGRTFMQAME